MSVEAIRFRAEGEFVILQVCEVKDNPNWGGHNTATWRDAKVEDLLLVAGFCKNKNETRLEMLEYVLNDLRQDVNNLNREVNV